MSLTVNSPPPFHTRRSSLRVDDDFFDPEGVRQLQRRLSRSLNRSEAPSALPSIVVPQTSEETDSTLSIEPFDLKKTLERLVSRYVVCDHRQNFAWTRTSDLICPGIKAERGEHQAQNVRSRL